MPWPSEAAPVTTSTMPELSTDTRTPSNGPSPLFSTKSARPAPMHSPTLRRRLIGATRRLVCEPHAPDGPIGRHAIGPGQHGGGKVRDRGRVGAHVAALIVEEFVIHREEAALGVDRRAHFVALLTGMIGGDQ